MRLFAAVELNDTVKDALCSVMEYMRSQGIEGRYTSRNNLHLTLAFIGESQRPDTAIRAIKSVSVKPFTIRLDGSGCFGNLLWAGIEDNIDLERLSSDISQSLRDEGFDIECRRFLPHITLVRRISRESADIRLKIPHAKMKVSSFSLMSTEQIDGRTVYEQLYLRRL